MDIIKEDQFDIAIKQVIEDLIDIIKDDERTLQLNRISHKATYKRVIMLIREYAKRNGIVI